jgi:hypothetical protein
MRFKLNASWSIETDIDQVTLIQTAIAQKGKFEGKMVDGRRWYWNNFEDALNGMIDRDIQCLEKVSEIEGRIATLKSEVQLMLKLIERSALLPPYTTHRKEKV